MPGLRKVDVRDDLLRLLGFESSGAASSAVLADVLAAMNFAQQALWTAGPDFFTRTAIDVTLVAGTATYTLADTVQSVLGPLRLPSGRTLRALESRGELDNFALLYLGQSATAMTNGTPLAYFIESTYQAGADPVRMKLHVAPAPDAGAAGAAVLDGVVECAIFTTSDLSSTDVLPVAQQYVETLFLPLARRQLSRSVYFSAQHLQEKLEADYQEATERLAAAGGFPPRVGRKEAREVEA